MWNFVAFIFWFIVIFWIVSILSKILFNLAISILDHQIGFFLLLLAAIAYCLVYIVIPWLWNNSFYVILGISEATLVVILVREALKYRRV